MITEDLVKVMNMFHKMNIQDLQEKEDRILDPCFVLVSGPGISDDFIKYNHPDISNMNCEFCGAEGFYMLVAYKYIKDIYVLTCSECDCIIGMAGTNL